MKKPRTAQGRVAYRKMTRTHTNRALADRYGVSKATISVWNAEFEVDPSTRAAPRTYPPTWIPTKGAMPRTAEQILLFKDNCGKMCRRDIAILYGISFDDTYYWARKFDVQRFLCTSIPKGHRFSSPEGIEELRLRGKTMTRQGLAASYGLDYGAMSYWVVKLGIRTVRPSPPTAHKTRLTPELEALLGTVTDVEIAGLAGVTRERVRQWRALRGISRYKKEDGKPSP
jgi:hypothetical protein